MPEKTPGDPAIAQLFGFPGFEALMRVTRTHVNNLRQEQGMPQLTWEEFLAEVITEMQDITNGT